MVVLVYFLSFPQDITEAQYQGQTLNERENVNATSSDVAIYDQTNSYVRQSDNDGNQWQ